MLEIIKRYKEDSESVYNTWFLNNDERLKAFRSIRKSLTKVIEEIENEKFGNDFKGSSLETVISAISEQKQIFEGAAHPFFWKPKLRIPDIYENEQNKKAYGRFLKGALEAKNEKQIIEEINRLDELKIKGVGPASANILYFLQPTLFSPFNTAILNGFNLLFGQKLKLGSWPDYFKMREFIKEMNNKYINFLSKDLGALSGLLFEIGSNRLVIEKNAEAIRKIEEEKMIKAIQKRDKQVKADELEENVHTEMQFYLSKLGRSLGYQVWVARNDHKRVWQDKKLGELSLSELDISGVEKSVYDTISLIDVLWLDQNHQIISGFEVEKSTSIYSGILRLNDLSISLEGCDGHFYLVAPEKREKDIQAQLLRPSFKNLNSPISYILFKDLRCDCDAMCKFGNDVSVLQKISKSVH